MRLSNLVFLILAICLVSSCNQGNKGSANASLGSSIIYPQDWPSFVVLPSNCKPYRTRLVAKFEKEGNIVIESNSPGGFIKIGFEYPDGWSKLVSHLDSIALSNNFVVKKDETNRVKDYQWKSVDTWENGFQVLKEPRRKNYYTISYWWE